MNIRIGNKNLKRVENCKYLGIYFDYNGKWTMHAEHIIKKTKYLNFLFYKIKNIVPYQTLIYYAFFHSVINYGIMAW